MVVPAGPVPPDAAFRVLDTTGRSGSLDPDRTVEPVVDRVLRVFADQNTMTISANRMAIAGPIRTMVADAVGRRFGLAVDDPQIAGLSDDTPFEDTIEAATTQRSRAVAAGYTVETARQEGLQREASAEADAGVAVARARALGRTGGVRAHAPALTPFEWAQHDASSGANGTAPLPIARPTRRNASSVGCTRWSFR